MKNAFSLLVLTMLTCLTAFGDNKKYGNNIVSFLPLSAVTPVYTGVGISYENLVNDYIGVRVPLTVAVNHTYVNGAVELKLYPTKHQGVVKYAVAPTLMLGYGVEKVNDYTWNSTKQIYENTVGERQRTQLGFLLNQSANFTILQSFHLGINGGLGVAYMDKTKYQGITNNNISFLAQIQFVCGYRF